MWLEASHNVAEVLKQCPESNGVFWTMSSVTSLNTLHPSPFLPFHEQTPFSTWRRASTLLSSTAAATSRCTSSTTVACSCHARSNSRWSASSPTSLSHSLANRHWQRLPPATGRNTPPPGCIFGKNHWYIFSHDKSFFVCNVIWCYPISFSNDLSRDKIVLLYHHICMISCFYLARLVPS